MKEYNFEGYDWTELTDFFGIEQDSRPLFDDGEPDDPQVMEKVKVTYFLNNTEVTIQTEDREEVLLEKLKRFLGSNLEKNNWERLDPEVREAVNAFLDVLIEESKKINYSGPAIKGIRELEDDFTFYQWFTDNLGGMWT